MPEDSFSGWVSRLVREQRQRLLRVARREGLSPNDAFDAVQEALHSFVSLAQARALADRDEEARALLSAMVRNSARNRRRRHHTSLEHVPLSMDEPDPGPTAEILLDTAQQVMLVQCCVTLLPRMQKAVVTLRLLEGRGGAEVARTLRLSPGHVAVVLHRAKQELRDCVEAAESMRAAS